MFESVADMHQSNRSWQINLFSDDYYHSATMPPKRQTACGGEVVARLLHPAHSAADIAKDLP